MINFFKDLNNIFYIREYILKKNNIFNFNDFDNSTYKDKIINKFFYKNSDLNCYLEISSLAGGNDSEDLNIYFFNFYLKWLNKKFFSIESIKNFNNKNTIFIKNNYSFSLFKDENGVHRIIRKNPLNSSNKIQTSYLNINILPKFDKNFILNNNDIILETFKSKGAGGQHVNTTNSAVRITHKPTNINVICQSERSQIKNKFLAIEILKYKIFIKNNFYINKYTNTFKNNKKYIKTYNFINNEIIDHIKKKKFNLNFYFKNYLNFIEL
ncbi:peptide chain release factor B [Candidatus Carsonella ruddii CS isolate Thao2000]|uniref:Peptide chain release factor B n=1 Tax=Candidatus Carsonella ruddii CS isolate Thao2000 TaxID=1202537 RepID=J7GSR1_CARRU|nr:peptide chain release factor-like protein [Candidatus Carsonella ruddii]AFP83792.1 peptide chain release factor B [Candidatus Carsonella ruddii CS isolate Thao2000]